MELCVKKVFKIKRLSVPVHILRPLTDDDKSCSLEELFVIPRGMLSLQDITHSVVLPQPQCGVHPQTGKKSEHLIADSDLVLRGDPGWVVHPDGNLIHSRRVHLTVDQLLRGQHSVIELLQRKVSTCHEICVCGENNPQKKHLILHLKLEFPIF